MPFSRESSDPGMEPGAPALQADSPLPSEPQRRMDISFQALVFVLSALGARAPSLAEERLRVCWWGSRCCGGSGPLAAPPSMPLWRPLDLPASQASAQAWNQKCPPLSRWSSTWSVMVICETESVHPIPSPPRTPEVPTSRKTPVLPVSPRSVIFPRLQLNHSVNIFGQRSPATSMNSGTATFFVR